MQQRADHYECESVLATDMEKVRQQVLGGDTGILVG